MKTAAIRKDAWRDEGGGYIRRGPFPKERSSVLLNRLSRDDATGRVIFSVSAKHGDKVHYEEGGHTAMLDSPVVQNGRLETTALRVCFIAIDSTGEHETGDPRFETNPITVRYDLAYRDGAHRVRLQAVPTGPVRYTTDGSNPRQGVVCVGGEVTVSEGTDVLLAIAESDGLWSHPSLQVDVPKAHGGGEAGQPYQPDPHRKAEWRHRLSTSDRGRAYKILECLQRHRGTIVGVDITVSRPSRPDDYVSMTFGPGIERQPDAIEKLASEHVVSLAAEGGTAELMLRIDGVHFESGAALLETARELDEPLVAGEVRQ